MGIFPSLDALIRLVGAVLAEQNDESAEGRRHLGFDILVELVKSSTTDELITHIGDNAIRVVLVY